MGDRQGRPSAVNLCPFVGVDLNLHVTDRLYSRHRADTWGRKMHEIMGLGMVRRTATNVRNFNFNSDETTHYNL